MKSSRPYWLSAEHNLNVALEFEGVVSMLNSIRMKARMSAQETQLKLLQGMQCFWQNSSFINQCNQEASLSMQSSLSSKSNSSLFLPKSFEMIPWKLSVVSKNYKTNNNVILPHEWQMPVEHPSHLWQECESFVARFVAREWVHATNALLLVTCTW